MADQPSKRRRKRKSNVDRRTANRRVLDELDDLYNEGREASGDDTRDDDGDLDNPQDDPVLETEGPGASADSRSAEASPELPSAGASPELPSAPASPMSKSSSGSPMSYHEPPTQEGSSAESDSDEDMQLYFGSLHFDCEVCVECSCIQCEVCVHSDEGADKCIHCETCVNGGTLSDSDEENYGSESDDEDNREEPVAYEESLRSELADICIDHNLKHSAVNDLLKFLRKHDVGKFPKDARTLLSTPSRIETRSVKPGEYWHLGLKTALTEYLRTAPNCKEVNVKFSFDGVPLGKSSGSSLSPLCCMFSCSSEVFLIGVYHGYQKPDDADDFLLDFIAEAEELSRDGFLFEDNVININFKCLICDAPAKSFLLRIKGHMAYFGCPKCWVEGSYRNRRMCYPDLNAACKTDDEYLQREGKTLLSRIVGFGAVSDVPLDYMHLVLLGVKRKTLYMWMSGPLKVRISGAKVKGMSEVLVQFKLFKPEEFVREPRSLQYVKTFKATEYRQLLLYTGIVVFHGKIAPELYDHFLALHVAISILVHPRLYESLNHYAHQLLVYYVERFSELYGAEYVSHNVHNLIHLAPDALKFGPLDAFSSFPFENFYSSLKKFVRKGQKPLQQIAKRYAEVKSVRQRKAKCGKKELSSFRGLHSSGPLVQGCSSPQYRIYVNNDVTFKVETESNNCALLDDGSVVLINNFATSSEGIVVIGQKFRIVTDFYSTPCQSSLLGIHQVSRPSQLMKWPVSQIKKKCYRMPFKEGYVVVPQLHSEKPQVISVVYRLSSNQSITGKAGNFVLGGCSGKPSCHEMIHKKKWSLSLEKKGES